MDESNSGANTAIHSNFNDNVKDFNDLDGTTNIKAINTRIPNDQLHEIPVRLMNALNEGDVNKVGAILKAHMTDDVVAIVEGEQEKRTVGRDAYFHAVTMSVSAVPDLLNIVRCSQLVCSPSGENDITKNKSYNCIPY